MAKIKPDWKLPDAPMCCGQPTILYAESHDDWMQHGDEDKWEQVTVWMFGTHCLCCDFCRDFECEWPFDRSNVSDDDMRRAGFDVEIEL
jgi:hypothetical protein